MKIELNPALKPKNWKMYNEKMDFKLLDDSVSPEYAVAHQSEFFDLVRTFAMINNGGKQFSSGFVRKVVDSDQKILYTSNCIGTSLVSNQTLKEMNELLKYNMLWGYEAVLLKRTCHLTTSIWRILWQWRKYRLYLMFKQKACNWHYYNHAIAN